jgi:hypothetical protein
MIRYIKHFAYVAKAYYNRIGCKHNKQGVASCPFTGLTYTTCEKCLKRIKVEETNG